MDERAKTLRDRLQKEVVALITEKIKQGEMSRDRAQKIASVILDKLPENISYDELMQIVPKLDDEFTELADIVVPIMIEYERKLHEVIENRVLGLVREKKFKEALAAAKKGIKMESKLS